MQITYQRFPALKLMSCLEENFPPVLSFICAEEWNRQFINNSDALYELFRSFARSNSRGLGETEEKIKLFNYVVSEELFIKYNYKRKLIPSNIIPYLHKRSYKFYGGMVISDLKEGLHYVYHIENLTYGHANPDKYVAYFSVGYFKGNTLLGFDDGMLDQDLEVTSNHVRYGDNRNLNGYLYFIGALFRHIVRFAKPNDLMREETKIIGLNFQLVLLHKAEVFG